MVLVYCVRLAKPKAFCRFQLFENIHALQDRYQYLLQYNLLCQVRLLVFSQGVV